METELFDTRKPVPEVISLENIMETWKRYMRPEDRCLYAFLYLTGCRITEALYTRVTDMSLGNENGVGDVFKVNLVNLKNRKVKFRTVPVLNKDPEKYMVEYIYNYISKFNINPEGKLFALSRTNAYNRIASQEITARAIYNKKVIENYTFKVWPHYLRHCRLTHLVQYYGLDVFQIMGFADQYKTG
jgi:site-specific recombinase XerD